MNTKVLMVASSAVLAFVGLVASFAPDELLVALKASAGEPVPVLIQLLGATYLAFAITNWTAKENLIGGIYSRPLSLGNFLHFVVGALALVKYQAGHGFGGPLVVVLIGYACFAIAFGYLVFGRGTACKVNEAS